jgi:iron complex transport system substrate-binding protein
MALIAAGEPQDSPMVTSTATFIEANQGFDGGWSWATPDNPWYWGSDTDDTAAALMALVAAGGTSDPTIVDNAVLYMQYNQGLNGGFQYDAWGAENLASTLWAVDAIVAIGQDPTSADWTTGATPIDFLMTYNKPDGSFLDEDAWSPNPYRNTADAIVSLLGKPYPVKIQETFTFEDPWRGTVLTINPECKTFRFTSRCGTKPIRSFTP